MKKRTKYTVPVGTEPNGAVLSKLIKAHKADNSTFTILESYVDDEPVMTRPTPSDSKLLTIHNFAQYITSINTGYLLGNPVDYKTTKGGNIDEIIENYSHQSIFELDDELERDCSMFGQAFENVFLDEESKILSAKLSVFNTIVVYDNSFKHNLLFAIYYSQKQDENGKEISDKYDITIWTKDNVLIKVLNKDVLEDIPEKPDAPHFFGTVPVVHYMNNKRLKGDYEPVISLIDAYNILQSDRVQDREKLVDAILAFYGAKLTKEDRDAIKENRVVGLPDGTKAEFITKNINEADSDVLRQTLSADIHKFSMTPDLTDESFGNAPSGVSILYKLLAFEQNIKGKEQLFEKALKVRFGLYSKVLLVKSKISTITDANTIDVVFSRALPKNDVEASQMINNLDGMVSQETLIGQLSFVQDASEEVKKAEKEKEINMEVAGFGTDNFEKDPNAVKTPPKNKEGK